MLKLVIITILLLTSNPAVGTTNQPRQVEARQSIKAINKPGKASSQLMVSNIIVRSYCSAYALKHNTMPEYVMAIAHIESRLGHREFRVGPMGHGTYYGPMGIRYDCSRIGFKKIEGNIDIGAGALSRINGNRPVKDLKTLKKVLKKYNASFDSKYWYQVRSAIKKYENRVSD